MADFTHKRRKNTKIKKETLLLSYGPKKEANGGISTKNVAINKCI